MYADSCSPFSYSSSLFCKLSICFHGCNFSFTCLLVYILVMSARPNLTGLRLLDLVGTGLLSLADLGGTAVCGWDWISQSWYGRTPLLNVAVYLLFAALLVFYLPHGTILFSFRHHCGGRLTKRQPTAPSSLDLLQKKLNVRSWLHASFRCVQWFYEHINLVLQHT